MGVMTGLHRVIRGETLVENFHWRQRGWSAWRSRQRGEAWHEHLRPGGWF